MDMFMDKLAQKLTAQEIIKANTAAEVEELTKLRNRVAEYNECLDRLQKLIEDGEGKVAGIQVNGDAINSLVAESLAKIKAMQQDATALEELREKLTVQLEEKMSGQMEALSVKLEEKVADSVKAQVEGLGETLQSKVDNTEMALAGRLDEKFAASDETVHKECVKVYRNVQAVITENAEQHKDMLGHALGKMSSQKARIKIVMGVTITTLILSLVNLVLEILQMMNIKLF